MGPLIIFLTDSGDRSMTWIIRVLIYAVVGFVISVISSRNRQRERHFEHLATHDPLTDLPNFNSITSAKIPNDGAMSILMMSFNEDSDIQGLFGSDFYSSIVKKISDELKNLLSSYPNATLCKANDLNYAIIVKHYSSEESLENILAAISNLNGVTISVDGIPVYVSYRIGFSVIRPGGSIPEGMRQANIALRYSFLEDQQISRYTDAMRDYYKGTVSIASEFSSAISKGMVQASYQTIHQAVTHEPVGVEILAKWVRDDGSKMTAEEFVPILEKTSCLQKLTIFMTEEAIRYAQLPVNQGRKFSINFSASELNERSVMEFVRSVESFKIDTDRVMVEITGAFAEDNYLVRDNLMFLRKHGIHIAIDYLSAVSSSFVLISDVPVDVIKINRSITSHIDQERGATLVRGIVDYASANGIKTIAEGIENESQVRFCEEAGVTYLQGYYFSVPQLMGADGRFSPDTDAKAFAEKKKESEKPVSRPQITIVKHNDIEDSIDTDEE
jgi:EAL domain-containing protein (putative c-di-GMP-specific phosphodiesterase class I)/GGDEF domain-containing protein